MGSSPTLGTFLCRKILKVSLSGWLLFFMGSSSRFRKIHFLFPLKTLPLLSISLKEANDVQLREAHGAFNKIRPCAIPFFFGRELPNGKGGKMLKMNHGFDYLALTNERRSRGRMSRHHESRLWQPRYGLAHIQSFRT